MSTSMPHLSPSPGMLSPSTPPSPNIVSTPDMFSTPRAAPRPPSPNLPSNQRPTSPYNGGNSTASPAASPSPSVYSSPAAARSQPQFAPANRNMSNPMAASASTSTVTTHQPGANSLTPNARLAPANAGGAGLSATPIANGSLGRSEGTGSRLSLYSNYSFYGVPDSPGSGSPNHTSTQLASSSNSGFSPGGLQDSNGARRPSANSVDKPQSSNGSRSPGPNGFSPMNPHQTPHGRLTPNQQQQPLWTPTLSPAQLTPEGLYQPQYVAEHPHEHRSFFKRKKTSISSGTTRSTTASPASQYNFSTGGAGAFGEKNGGPHIALPQASSPEEYLQLGITHHERDELALSAHCFEQSATLNGGCGFGMLMWGLTLRHGWGVRRDEKTGFAWVRQAADAAVGDLEAAVEGVEADAVKVRYQLTRILLDTHCAHIQS